MTEVVTAEVPRTYNDWTMDAQSLTFSLVDQTSGYEASPERVHLAVLAEFTADVSTLLRGSSREVDTGTLDVAVRSGSLAIQTEPIAAAPILFRDLRALLSSELLDAIDVKRREILERWQKAARQTGVESWFIRRKRVIENCSDREIGSEAGGIPARFDALHTDRVAAYPAAKFQQP